jgi:hypothetical protein
MSVKAARIRLTETMSAETVLLRLLAETAFILARYPV